MKSLCKYNMSYVAVVYAYVKDVYKIVNSMKCDDFSLAVTIPIARPHFFGESFCVYTKN